jgi:hypothetical protein
MSVDKWLPLWLTVDNKLACIAIWRSNRLIRERPGPAVIVHIIYNIGDCLIMTHAITTFCSE